jgi:hypothetical protein
MPETYVSSSWFLLRGDLSSSTTRNFDVTFCLLHSLHFQHSCSWEIYTWNNRVLYLTIVHCYNYFYKDNVMEMLIPSAVAD